MLTKNRAGLRRISFAATIAKPATLGTISLAQLQAPRVSYRKRKGDRKYRNDRSVRKHVHSETQKAVFNSFDTAQQ